MANNAEERSSFEVQSNIAQVVKPVKTNTGQPQRPQQSGPQLLGPQQSGPLQSGPQQSGPQSGPQQQRAARCDSPYLRRYPFASEERRDSSFRNRPADSKPDNEPKPGGSGVDPN